VKKHVAKQTKIFLSVLRWLFLSSFMGVIIGTLIALFLRILKYTINSRGILPFHYYFMLPIALPLTIFVAKKFTPHAQEERYGTEKIIRSVYKRSGKIDVAIMPIKLLSTVFTIFIGGSVGKEGPSAKIGAGVAFLISSFLKFSNANRKKLVICSISAGFASVFGTPIAGAIFGIEVLTVGISSFAIICS